MLAINKEALQNRSLTYITGGLSFILCFNCIQLRCSNFLGRAFAFSGSAANNPIFMLPAQQLVDKLQAPLHHVEQFAALHVPQETSLFLSF
jgi:hypothetical protein